MMTHIFWLGLNSAVLSSLLFISVSSGVTDPTSRNVFAKKPVDDLKTPVRSFISYDRDISAFLRNQAIAQTEFEHAAAIRDLCTLAIEIRYDRRFERSARMQVLMKRIRSRLDKIAQKEAKRINRLETNDIQLLAQEVSLEDSIDDMLSDNLEISGFASGGPLAFFSQTYGANGGGIIRANADDLIRLIQSTISPSFWDVNGGVGTIQFYAPLNALVIRATEDIHYRIGGSIGRMHRLNR